MQPGTLQHFTILNIAEEELAFSRLFQFNNEDFSLTRDLSIFQATRQAGENPWA